MTDKELIKQEIKKLIERAQAERVLQPKTILAAKNLLLIEDYNKLISFIDSLPEEPASEDLEDAAYHFCMDEYGNPKESLFEFDQRCFKAGAEWQKHQMKEILRTEYEKGRFDMREEMMKDAVEGEVVYKIGNAEIAPTDVRYKVMSDRVYIPNVKLGDKVKIIIIKEN